MVSNDKDLLKAEIEGEAFIQKYWRPACAVTYLVICIFDFLLFPVIFGVHSFIFKDKIIQPWSPLTLQGGGLFHVAFSSIVSITAWQKSKEKIAAMNPQFTTDDETRQNTK